LHTALFTKHTSGLFTTNVIKGDISSVIGITSGLHGCIGHGIHFFLHFDLCLRT